MSNLPSLNHWLLDPANTPYLPSFVTVLPSWKEHLARSHEEYILVLILLLIYCVTLEESFTFYDLSLYSCKIRGLNNNVEV